MAKKLNGEIISADSMQIYKDMNIGTAKPTLEEQEGIKHYLLDIVNPEEEFNVTKYKELAEEAIEEILAKKKVPIVVGGTGLYISSLTDAISFSDVPEDPKYREELGKIAKEEGPEVLHQKLKEIDEASFHKIDQNNVRRVIRALEIFHVTGKTKTELDKESIGEAKYDFKIYGILWDREKLYERIEKRVDLMLADGLIDEINSLREKYPHLSKTALQGIGYKEVIPYLEGNCSYDEMVEKLKMETRRYAKRQMTWFRRDKKIKWCNAKDVVQTIIDDMT